MNQILKISIARGGCRFATPLYLGASYVLSFDGTRADEAKTVLFVKPNSRTPRETGGIAGLAVSVEEGSDIVLKLNKQALVDWFVENGACDVDAYVDAHCYVFDADGAVIADSAVTIEYRPVDFVVDSTDFTRYANLEARILELEYKELDNAAGIEANAERLDALEEEDAQIRLDMAQAILDKAEATLLEAKEYASKLAVMIARMSYVRCAGHSTESEDLYHKVQIAENSRGESVIEVDPTPVHFDGSATDDPIHFMYLDETQEVSGSKTFKGCDVVVDTDTEDDDAPVGRLLVNSEALAVFKGAMQAIGSGSSLKFYQSTDEDTPWLQFVNSLKKIMLASGTTLESAANETHSGMESHSGSEIHTGAESHTGTESHTGAETHKGNEIHGGESTDDTNEKSEVHYGSETHHGTEAHNGAETHNGEEAHNGVETHNGNAAFNGVVSVGNQGNIQCYAGIKMVPESGTQGHDPIFVKDSNGEILGYVEVMTRHTPNVEAYNEIRLVNHRKNGNTDLYHYIGIGADNVGKSHFIINGVEQRYIIAKNGNSTSGYVIYNDGWCEQWGFLDANTLTGGANYESWRIDRIDLFAAYDSANYNIQISSSCAYGSWYNTYMHANVCGGSYPPTQHNFHVNWYLYHYPTNGTAYVNKGLYWRTCGYLAAGQY